MIAVVTGAAGFIGSTLSRRLLDDGHKVTGIDALTKAYDIELKIRNVDNLVDHRNFQLVYGDLTDPSSVDLLRNADVVFHLAGQASVTSSWGRSFETYARNNIMATQRLLDVLAGSAIKRFVYASSSSVYGEAMVMPTVETALTRPISPYGVSKLAAENLCHAYQREQGIPVTSLRFFTVYGPAQRPDMAFHRMFRSVYRGEVFEVRGDGTATRDFTFVGDVVEAILAAASCGWNGVANVGGGNRVSLREVLAIVEEVAGPLNLRWGPTVAGDVRDTGADIDLARDALGWEPRTDLYTGLRTMAAWAEELLRTEPSHR
ncbi:MAG: NAD-dependent epimerase/dehydratase family protein [Aquihabitans sp.]